MKRTLMLLTLCASLIAPSTASLNAMEKRPSETINPPLFPNPVYRGPGYLHAELKNQLKVLQNKLETMDEKLNDLIDITLRLHATIPMEK